MKFLLFGIVPIPAWAFVPGVLLYDLYEMVASRRVRVCISLKTKVYGCMGLCIFRIVQMTTTDTAGHVGGIFAGIAYFLSRRAGIRL